MDGSGGDVAFERVGGLLRTGVPHAPEIASPRAPTPRTAVAGILRRVAAQDWLLVVYFLVLLAEVLRGSGPRRSAALGGLSVDLAVFVTVLALVRGGLLGGPFLAGLLYRLTVLGTTLASFFQLQWILPSASGRSLDAELHALDVRLFGVEPSLWFDRYVDPALTEWFSFFYYGYFFLLAIHVIPSMLFLRTPRVLSRFGFGILWLYCVGHVVYTLVPAYGPYAHFGFAHPLVGDVWWPLVQRTVAAVDGSARTDVFPSLHTAGPVFLALFSFEHRWRAPFRYTWLPIMFIASQIVVATMFLRWHYLVDIFAGITLATTGILVGRLAVAFDEARERAGGTPVFPALSPRIWLRSFGPLQKL